MQRLTLVRNQLSAEAPLPTFTKIKYETNAEGTVAIINLASPSDLNALSKELRKDIMSALGYAQASTKVKVVLIISSVDKAFCAGANIKEFTSCTMESQMTNDVFEDITLVLGNYKKPIIAAVNGVALGGGMELALASDIIICSEDARFGLPELRLGLIPGLGGTQRLTKIVGKVNASRYIFTSDFITAADAKTMGLVSDVYKKENLRTEAINLANRIAAEKSLYTLVTAKTAIKAADELGITQGIDYERQVFNRLFSTKACKEGVDAFLQKRKPNFNDI